MARMSRTLGIAAVLAAGLAGAAAAQPAPVGSLCNADGRIEVMAQVSSASCAGEPGKEMKALFKARAEFQENSQLSPEQRGVIDARIQRRIRELRAQKNGR